VDVVIWLLSRGKRRHGSAVQGDATSWYCQTAGDLNDLRASPVGHRRKLLAAFTALRSDIGLVPARPAASTIESARERAMEPTSSQRRSQLLPAISRADEVNK
jgi:hypothetical protein